MLIKRSLKFWVVMLANPEFRKMVEPPLFDIFARPNINLTRRYICDFVNSADYKIPDILTYMLLYLI